MAGSPWKALYALTWLLAIEFLLALAPGDPTWTLYAHVALGVVVVAVAANNARALRATRAPGRVKRTSISTMQLSIAMAILGAALVFDVGTSWGFAGITVYGVVLFAHVLVAVAMLAQAAATGIAFDMWEEKEYLAETEAGEVPALQVPEANAPAKRRPGAGS